MGARRPGGLDHLPSARSAATGHRLAAAADAILRESGSPCTLPGLISALDEVISQLIRATRHAIADITPPSCPVSLDLARVTGCDLGCASPGGE
jgi:hypothetical protein